MADIEKTEAKQATPKTPRAEAQGVAVEREDGIPASAYANYAKASELLLSTARAIYENQADVFRLQAEQVAKAWRPMAPGADISAVADQIHENAERMIACSRRTNDLIRDCGWKFSALFADDALQLSKRFQSALSKAVELRS